MTYPSPIRRVSGLGHPQPTVERYFGLMGETLLFQTNSPLLLAAAEDAFGRYPIPAEPADSPLIVRLFVHEPAANPACPPMSPFPRPIFHTQGHLFSISVGAQNLGVADLHSGYAYGFVSPAVAADRAYVRYTFVESLGLSMLSLARGYVPVHAACVVKNGRAVMVQASAGTGKSTLAYACLRRGYHLLAEDVVHVSVTGPELQLWGTPWKFHLLPDACTLFPELADQQAYLQMNGEWKLELDLETCFPGCADVCAAPGPVILLERGAKGETGLAYLLPDAALQAFEVIWPWGSGWTETHERQISRLITNGAYRLRMNGSPDTAVDQIDQLLEELP